MSDAGTGPLRRVELGRSGLRVPPLGVGCWAWGDRRYWGYEREHTPGDVVDAFGESMSAGLRLFDTAESYGWGEGEKILGFLAQKCPPDDRPLLATKYAPLSGRGGAAAVAKGIAGSLQRLRAATIDLYQLHWADSEEAPIAAMMGALADAVDGKKARAVGVSNFRASELREAHAALAARGVPLATCQVKWSLLHRAPEVDGVVDTCRELGVTLLAYSPLEQGLLAAPRDPGRPPAGPRGETPWFQSAHVEASRPVLDAATRIGASHGTGPAPVALAWLMVKGAVPLAGARRGAQARQNARALEIALSPEEIAALDTASAPFRGG